MSDQLLTVKDVARMLKVSETWVRQREAAGVIPSIRVGGVIRFNEDKVRAWLEGN